MVNFSTILTTHSRKIVGVSLLLLSLLAALGILKQSDNRVEMWSAEYSLPEGATVHAKDIRAVKVSLGVDAPSYFSRKAEIVGSYVSRDVAQGELIPVSSLRKASSSTPKSEVPLGINKSDLPLNLRIGDSVDIYSIPSKDSKGLTSLVVPAVHVAAIDSQSQSMGGVITILISVDPKNISLIADAIQAGRILVVRHAI